MFKYSKYLFANIFSKKGFWITLLISLITISVVGFLRIKDQNERGMSAIDEINNDSKFLPFIFASLVTILTVVYTFKDGQIDGSELLIASKPLSRRRIILGKFLVLIVMIIIMQVLIFTTISIYSQFDTFSSSLTKWRYSASIAIGGLVIMLIVGSVSSFLAIYLTRIGLIALGVISSAMIPIISMIIAPISKGSPHELSVVRQTGIRLANSETISNFEKDLDHMYEDGLKDLFVDGNVKKGWKHDVSTGRITEEYKNRMNAANYIQDSDIRILPQRPKDDEKAASYFSERWYDKAAPFDVWYQWSGFYDVLMGKDQVSAFNPIRWELEDSVVNYGVEYSLDPKDDPTKDNSFSKVFLVINQNSLGWKNFEAYILPDRVRSIVDQGAVDSMTGRVVRDEFNNPDISLEERLKTMIHIVDPTSTDVLRYDELYLYNKIVERLKAKAPAVNGIYPFYKKPNYLLQPQGNSLVGSNAPRLNPAERMKQSSFMMIKGDHVYTWVHHKYIETQKKVWIWSSIAAFVFLLTIGIYLRRDFK